MLSNNLTAYRKNQNCETSLIGLVERWKQAVDNKNVVGVLSTDISKAFDSLYPPLLINKLRAYGFSNSLTLMRSHFTNRKNRVRTSQETTSDWYATTRGCPQGLASHADVLRDSSRVTRIPKDVCVGGYPGIGIRAPSLERFSKRPTPFHR